MICKSSYSVFISILHVRTSLELGFGDIFLFTNSYWYLYNWSSKVEQNRHRWQKCFALVIGNIWLKKNISQRSIIEHQQNNRRQNVTHPTSHRPQKKKKSQWREVGKPNRFHSVPSTVLEIRLRTLEALLSFLVVSFWSEKLLNIAKTLLNWKHC